jgi:hypothetical protein
MSFSVSRKKRLAVRERLEADSNSPAETINDLIINSSS